MLTSGVWCEVYMAVGDYFHCIYLLFYQRTGHLVARLILTEIKRHNVFMIVTKLKKSIFCEKIVLLQRAPH